MEAIKKGVDFIMREESTAWGTGRCVGAGSSPEVNRTHNQLIRLTLAVRGASLHVKASATALLVSGSPAELP